MTKTNKLACALGAFALTAGIYAGPAAAEETDRKWAFSFNVGGTTDYIFRGFSQSDEQPAFQAGVDLTYGIFYVGAWGSGVDKNFVGGASAEIDVYAGITPSAGIFDFDLGVIYYGYPNQSFALSGGVDVDYWEGKFGVSTDDLVKNLTLGVTAYYSPEYTFETGEVYVVEGSISYGLPSVGPFSPSISALAGYLKSQDGSNGGLVFDAAGTDDDYWYWNAGLELAIEKFTIDLRYWDTDVDQAPAVKAVNGLADERFVLTGTFTY